MLSYTIRDIDPELWRKFKSDAALKQLTIRELLLQLIKASVKR